MHRAPKLAFAVALATITPPLIAQTSHPGPGVALELAQARAQLVSDLRYDLALSLPEAGKEPISGRIAIELRLVAAPVPLVVDFDTSREHVLAVRSNGATTDFDFVDGHVVIPATALRRGANRIEIAFTAGDAPLNRQADFLYTLFVPARARQAIPCFDQPDLKGRWTVSLDHPAEWQSVANSAEVERVTEGGRTRVRFAETVPLPTYLVAFVAGAFKVETAERQGRTMRFFHRETDAEKVRRNRDAVFDLHAAALDYAEGYTGIPYPFGKLDFVAIPAFPFGAMEHAGAIVYSAPALLLEESASQRDLLERAHVIAHEVAHAWFGNLVTMRWFDDVWTKEVFANFIAAKIVAPSFPAMNHDLRFFLDHYPGAYGEDRTPGAGPVRQPLANLADAGSLYTAIIYLKAPIAMRHLEALLGEENFRDGLREYLRAHAHANATWADLIASLSPRAPVDLSSWSRVWIDSPGRAAITTELKVSNGRISRLALVQNDERRRGLVWPQRLKVALGNARATEIHEVLQSSATTEVATAVGRPSPRFVLPSAGGWGYADFILDPVSLDGLVQELPRIGDPLTRGSAWITLWDALVDRRLAPTRFFELALRAVSAETDEQLTATMLEHLETAWWRYLRPEQRRQRAARLEGTLRRGLARAPSSSRKAAWFEAQVLTATTPATLARLQRIWEQKQHVPGLTLGEADYTKLALELAVREVPGWRRILALQSQRITNPDRKAQFEFVSPALSADPAQRARWFEQLGAKENRSRERWVVQGLAYLHHPLRADASSMFIRPTLDLLPEVHATGYLGFPRAWVDYTLRGHNSRAAAETVERFVSTLPTDYPAHLRDIVLLSADPLWRAARIVGR